MNQRQIKRMKTLIDVVANKITTKQPLRYADYVVQDTACGTKGCIWGDFVIAMRGVDVSKLNRDLRGCGLLKTFAAFNDYITNQTLAKVGDVIQSVVTCNINRNFTGYFGTSFDTDLVFGAADDGSWLTRYLHLVEKLSQKGIHYNPLEIPM